ncbi:hypothetical protein P280DRAFT_416781, partial [Massarina eburnea CBS 473.64]
MRIKWTCTDAKMFFIGYAGYTTTNIQPEFTRLLADLTTPTSPPTLLFTIFLGANDACYRTPDTENVPLPTFTTNLKTFLDAILTSPSPSLKATKILLITPPPINIPSPETSPQPADFPNPKDSRGYRTYRSKKRYADKVLELANAYTEVSGGRVVGLDFWSAVVDAGLEDQGRGGEVPGSGSGEKYDEDRLPGCGLDTAKEFADGYFTDGLHLGVRGYRV